MGNSNGNLFCTTSGTGNKWDQEANVFCRFHGKNNNIKSRCCVNTKFQGDRNTAILMNNVNLKFKGDQNSGTLLDNVNIKLIGNCNHGQIESNVNAEILGNKNVLKMNSNMNAFIHGHGNTINANDNINFKVEGNNHKITSLVNTVNHNLKIAQDGCAINRVGIEAKKGGGVTKTNDGHGNITYTTSSSTSTYSKRTVTSHGGNREKTEIKTTHCYPWAFYINYVREMSIDRSKYRLGIFDFKMKIADNGKSVEAIFDHCKYDKGMINAVVEPPGKVTLAATKAGKQETLEMVGPTVSIKETNGMSNVRISE